MEPGKKYCCDFDDHTDILKSQAWGLWGSSYKMGSGDLSRETLTKSGYFIFFYKRDLQFYFWGLTRFGLELSLHSKERQSLECN